MHINGWVLALAVLALATVVFLWIHRLGARLISIGVTVVAGLLILAVPAWTDALAGLFGNGPGEVALVILAFLGAGSFVMDHARHHHPVRTAAFGAVAGTCALLALAMAPELSRRGSRLGPRTAAAFGHTVKSIRDGHAAAAETASQRLVVIAVALLVFAAIWLLAHRAHKAKPFPKAVAYREIGSRPRAALPPGAGGSSAGRRGGLLRGGILKALTGGGGR